MAAADERGPGSAATWTLQNLGLLEGGTWSEAYGIGDNGWVVGAGDWSDQLGCGTDNGAFVYKGGELVNLHLETPQACGGARSAALDVNASGTVVGYYTDPAADHVAAIWNANDDYTTIAGGCPYAQAHGINNAGTVVGWFNNCLGVGEQHPFVWTLSGGMVDALPAGYFSGRAVDITDNGVIIGELDGQTARWKVGGAVTIITGAVSCCYGRIGWGPFALGGAQGGFVGSNGTQSWKFMSGVFSNITALSPGYATDVSIKKRIVGWRTQPNTRAVTIKSGTVSLLPGLSVSKAAYASSVNACGAIAGYSPNAAGLSRAVVWQINACDP